MSTIRRLNKRRKHRMNEKAKYHSFERENSKKPSTYLKERNKIKSFQKSKYGMFVSDHASNRLAERSRMTLKMFLDKISNSEYTIEAYNYDKKGNHLLKVDDIFAVYDYESREVVTILN